MNSGTKDFPLSPRRKLKRDRNTFTSTADSFQERRATDSSRRQTISERPPTFFTSNLDAKPRQSVLRVVAEEKPNARQQKHSLQQRSCVEARDRVASYLAYDDYHSTMQGQTKQESAMLYLATTLQSFDHWALPSAVTEEYERVSSTRENFTVSWGILLELGFQYFTINRTIFFIGINPCLKKQRPSPPERFEVRSDVLSILECKASPTLLLRGNKNKMLVMSHYEYISLYLAQVTDGNITIEELYLSVHLPGQTITKMVSTDDGRLLYVDRLGQLSMIFDQPVKRLYLFNTGTREVVSDSQQPCYIKQFVQKYGESGMVDSLKFMAKSVSYRWHRMFAKKLSCAGIEIDSKRGLVYTLVKATYGNYSYDHTLCVYYTAEEKVKLWHCFTEEDLFKHLDDYNLKLRRRKLKIHCIKVVEQYFPDANLMLVTSNGTRIYLSVTKSVIRPIRAIYPPDAEGFEVVSTVAQKLMHPSFNYKVLSDPSNDCELLAVALKREQALVLYAMSSRVMSYFCNRPDSKSRVTIGDISWTKLTGSCQRDPEKVACWALPSCSGMDPDIQKLLSQRSSPNEIPVVHTHEFASQTYLPPDFYLAHNEQESELLCHTRPIDTVFTWLLKLPIEECQARLEATCSTTATWKLVQVIAMLYIIASDTSFDFYLTSVQEQALEVSGGRTTSQQQKVSTCTILNSQQLDLVTKEKANRLIDNLGAKQEQLRERDLDDELDVFTLTRMDSFKLQPCSTKEQALCLYAARLLRPVWFRKAEELTQNQTHFVSAKLRDFLKYMDNTPPEARLISTKKKDGTREPQVQKQLQFMILKCLQLLGLIRSVPFECPYEFHELLVQDSYFFEAILFSQLRKYSQKDAKAYEAGYSSLVGDKFSRIIFLYYKTSNSKDEKEIRGMCEEFGCLPSYFLDYIRLQKGIQTSAMRVDVIDKGQGADSYRRRVMVTGSPTEQYDVLLECIETTTNAKERLRLIGAAKDKAQAILQDKAIDQRTRASIRVQLNDLLTRRKVTMVQLALIDSVLNSDNHYRVVEVLNSREVSLEQLRQSVLKCNDPIVKLIWCVNFSPRLQSQNITELIREVINPHLPGKAEWPKQISRTLAYFFNHVAHEHNRILLTELAHELERINFENNQVKLGECLKDFDLDAMGEEETKQMLWVPEMLLAQGFNMPQICDVYSKHILSLLSDNALTVKLQPKYIEAYFWLFSLRRLVLIIKMEVHNAQLHKLCEDFISYEQLNDRPEDGEKLRRLMKP